MKLRIKPIVSICWAMLFITSLYFSCATTGRAPVSVSPGDKSTVAGILEKLPAENAAAENTLSADLIKLGAPGVNYIGSLLVPQGTGDDTKSRYALSGLARYVSRSGAESERAAFAGGIINALNSPADPEVKAFLISLLQLAGKDEAVLPLSKYLRDVKLSDPAARALVTIHTPGAEAELLKALPSAKENDLITIVKALGEFRSKGAVSLISKYATSENKNLRLTALWALANIGSPASADLLAKATQASSASTYEKQKLNSFYVLYTQLVMEDGKKQSIEMSRNLLKTKTAPADANVQIAALTTLTDAAGKDALGDILAAVDNPNKDVRSAALALAASITGKPATEKWLAKMKTAAPEIQGEINTMLKQRADNSALAVDSKTSKAAESAGSWVDLFNGKDLTGWKGLVEDPIKRAKMSPEELAKAQAVADESMRTHWKVIDGVLVYDGKGNSICTVKDYSDFEMVVDWQILPNGDSGIYLRGSPQVQIWDPAKNPEGSGGLYNNKINPAKPLKCADKPVGEWNSFRIKMISNRVTVYLNDVLVVDNVVMENYWDRNQPIFPTGQIELQHHGNTLKFKNIRLREIPRENEWVSLFNGKDLKGWVGDTISYAAEDGKIVINPGKKGGTGNLYTEKEYSNFHFKFDFKLVTNSNNGIGIRAPLKGDAAYVAMEIQVLDDTGDQYTKLNPYQYHGSIYGVVPAKRGFLKPVGEWNSEEIIANGKQITVILNGFTIVDADIDKASTPKTPDGREHPGLKNEKGHIGFLGHGYRVEFRDLKIMELK